MASAQPAEITVLLNAEAMANAGLASITALTEAATNATFYRDDLTPEEIAANRRVVSICAPTCEAAAQNPHQHLAIAFIDGQPGGYVIATRHGENDLELDWLMVHPRHHGSDLSALLMRLGIEWLGPENPMWLNVLRHNERAIHFYRKFGFEIDPTVTTHHVIPHWVMRRPAGLPLG